MKGLYEITVSDSFCTWKFQLNPKAGNTLSIDDIMNVLYKHLDAPKDVGVNVSTEMEEQAIAFGEWLLNSDIVELWCEDGKWLWKSTMYDIDNKYYTTEELYNEFLKSL